MNLRKVRKRLRGGKSYSRLGDERRQAHNPTYESWYAWRQQAPNNDQFADPFDFSRTTEQPSGFYGGDDD